jgi:hypothetical protein
MPLDSHLVLLRGNRRPLHLGGRHLEMYIEVEEDPRPRDYD